LKIENQKLKADLAEIRFVEEFVDVFL